MLFVGGITLADPISCRSDIELIVFYGNAGKGSRDASQEIDEAWAPV